MDIKQSDMNIFMGISEQSRHLKGFTGVDKALNVSYDVNKGLKKRNPTFHIKTLNVVRQIPDSKIFHNTDYTKPNTDYTKPNTDYTKPNTDYTKTNKGDDKFSESSTVIGLNFGSLMKTKQVVFRIWFRGYVIRGIIQGKVDERNIYHDLTLDEFLNGLPKLEVQEQSTGKTYPIKVYVNFIDDEIFILMQMPFVLEQYPRRAKLGYWYDVVGVKGGFLNTSITPSSFPYETIEQREDNLKDSLFGVYSPTEKHLFLLKNNRPTQYFHNLDGYFVPSTGLTYKTAEGDFIQYKPSVIPDNPSYIIETETSIIYNYAKNQIVYRKIVIPKEDVPKENVPKENVPKEDVPKENVPKEDVPKENVSSQVIIVNKQKYKYKPFITYIDRDENVKYAILIYEGEIQIYDRHGNKANISMQSSYLSSMQSADDIRVVSIADHLFILNKRVTPSMTGTIEDSFDFSAQGSLINIKQGQYGRTYQILSGSSVIAEHTTPNGEKPEMTAEISLTVIRDKLVEGLKGKGYSCGVGEGWIYIPNNTSIKTNDGFNNNAMWAINSSVQTFSKLPPDAPDGYTVEVSNEPDHNAKSTPYYIRYNGLKKVWKEIAKPNQNNSITNSSMPHELVREGNGSFTFRSASWDKRLIGDDNSNDKPGFIDTTLTSITFHRDRLILATAESIYCSESGNYYNFWLTSTSNTLDSDPIDIGISSSQINLINHMLPYDGQLYIFTNNAQFVLQSETYLSPQTCALVEVTTYPSTIKCPPIRRGQNMYFVAEKSEHTSLFEYYTVMSTSAKKSAKNLSLSIPTLIPKGVYTLLTHELVSNIFLLTETEPNTLYIYSFPPATVEELNAGTTAKTPVSFLELEGKWTKWQFQGEIIGGFISGDSLYLFMIHDSLLCLEKIYLINDIPNTDSMPYIPSLDRLKWAVSAHYNPKDDYTYFFPNEEYVEGQSTQIVESENTFGYITPEGKYHLLTPQNFEKEEIKNAVRLRGDYTNKKVLIGKPYIFLVKQSMCELRNNQTQLPLINKYIKIKQLEISVSDTGYLEVLINVNEKSKVNNKIFKKKYTARNINNSNNYIGVIPKDTDTFRVPIHLQQRKFSYTLFSEQPLPLTIDRVLVTYNIENNIQEV